MMQRPKTGTDESLMLLRTISENPQITQRELSSKLGLSLGKVNYLMKSLIAKGFIKANNFKNSQNKIAYLYLLPPRGIEEKAKITYHFLRRKTEEYERLEKEIQDLQKEVELLAKSATENR